MDPNYLNPLSNQLSYAEPAEIYDLHRPVISTAGQEISLRSLINEARGRESAHDLDPPPAEDADMERANPDDENARSEQGEPNDDDGVNENEHDMEANVLAGAEELPSM